MRNNNGSGLVALIIILILVSLVHLEGQSNAIAGKDDDPPEYYNLEISVAPIQTTTAPTGWKMANISFNKKKFVIFYEKDAKINLGWGTGRPERARPVYNVTDESNPPGPNGWKPSGAFMLKLGYTNNKEFSVGGVEYLNEKNYLKESGLQDMVLKNDEEKGKAIFEKIHKKLEKIDTSPPPLKDE